MINKAGTIFLILFLVANYSFCQQNYTLLNNESSFKYENFIYNQTTNFHTSIKPYLISEINKYDSINSNFIIRKDNHSTNFLLNRNFIFKSKHDFNIAVNPVFETLFSADIQNNTSVYIQSVGFAANSNITKKLSFRLNLVYNKNQYYDYLLSRIDSINIIPHWGKIDKQNSDSYYFNYTTGYVSYSPTKYFNFQLGNDKNFWGDGERSLLLSDNSNAYPFFKISFNIWKIKYIVLYSFLHDIDFPDEHNYQKKYSTSHYLSWNINKRLNISLFETVVWKAEDTLNYRKFDVNYVNPIIFFRPAEYQLGDPSPDNVLMGCGFKYKIGKSNHLYGQVIIDEFNLQEIKKFDGWWANKQGFQLGIKSYNFLSVKNLYFLTEFNYVRPYTYSHLSSLQNYGNYYQAMAHPLGANFEESMSILRYNYKRFSIKAKFIYAVYGLDSTQNISYGQNIYKPYTYKPFEYGHETTQGLKTKFLFSEILVSYLINPKINLRLIAGVNTRQYKTSSTNNNSSCVFVGLKTDLYNEAVDY
ncbi:MAG: hypothetical protein DRJ01_06195 [Bacteroidetes bacterium]|nr:MAG: hypothetical protein DRJ01_06195 [Bacteroidota bacterium]